MLIFALARPGTRLVILLALGVAVLPAHAGTISLEWDAVSDPDLDGYRLYYGQSPGAYGNPVDVGRVTRHTLTGLADCTTWYLAVKAYDTSGVESTDFSDEVSGWARPEADGAAPPLGERGAQIDLVVTGTNFETGAVVGFANPEIAVNSVSVNSCTELAVNVTIGVNAPLGATDAEVTNPDQVYGTGAGLFTVVAPDTVPPAISNVQSSNVTESGARITWTTDEPSDSQVLYRRAGESAYQQTAIAPAPVTSHSVQLSGLLEGTIYEYHVRSADASGNASTSSPDLTFSTAVSPPGQVSNVRRADRKDPD